MRLHFLADWSRFLTTANVTGEEQARIQRALQAAQTSFLSADDDLAAHVVRIWLKDARTGRIGNAEAQEQFSRFVEGRELARRAAFAESVLLREVRTAIGEARHDRFRAEVWPAIFAFGFARPMRPPETVVLQ